MRITQEDIQSFEINLNSEGPNFMHITLKDGSEFEGRVTEHNINKTHRNFLEIEFTVVTDRGLTIDIKTTLAQHEVNEEMIFSKTFKENKKILNWEKEIN